MRTGHRVGHMAFLERTLCLVIGSFPSKLPSVVSPSEKCCQWALPPPSLLWGGQ